MPDISIDIGGRSFAIACEPGEEPQARAAAELLNAQAKTLQAALGRLPESRMLLMAGLMLADLQKELEWKAKDASERVADMETRLRKAESKAAALAADLELQARKAPSAEPSAAPASLFDSVELPDAMKLLESTAKRLEKLVAD
ncbi:cell division protein ZapA [Abyssibius alkaniclasticus]|uniref:cell division protein ZapA n=1 Tax=Abyssibius alkaniclasticus TaxID=2881234 RepID=UPI00405825B3|tara:strand:- start:50 stop:481 length:432 start_codon:yes stop_codon:yes gene_type:complete